MKYDTRRGFEERAFLMLQQQESCGKSVNYFTQLGAINILNDCAMFLVLYFAAVLVIYEISLALPFLNA